MDSLLPFFLLCFTSFFTLTNPLGTMPVFLTMTNGMSEEQRRAIVRRATIVSFLTLMVFTFSGQFLFKFFGISTNGFRIAGILIGTIGLIYFITYLILRASTRLNRYMGETGNNVMMRLMGLILMVIAVECFVSGFKPIMIDILQHSNL